ncbi:MULTISPECIES: DUF4765 family protein [unclassified Streptomyces]|uniref:DUF4765 family protein n=1 Tax=unclassified Streptomyces TaxID=2593676 RepID=UPI0037F7255F
MKKKLLRVSTMMLVVGSLALGTTAATTQSASAACGDCPYWDWSTHRTTTINQQDEKKYLRNHPVYHGIKTAVGALSLLAGPLPEMSTGVVVGPEVGGVEVGGPDLGAQEAETASSGGGTESSSRSGGSSEEPAGERPAQNTEGAGAREPATGSPHQAATEGTVGPVELDKGPEYSVTSPTTDAAAGLELQFETLVVEGPTRYSTGPTRLPEDDPNYDSDGDDFDERYRETILQPTEQKTVAEEVAKQSERTVTLWRGTRLEVAEAMARNGSASGDTPSVNATAPRKAAIKNQVARGGSLPEFTTNVGVAAGFSNKSALVVVDIKAKYLAQGSKTEAGWVANRDAPVTVRIIVDRTGPGAAGARPNAS